MPIVPAKKSSGITTRQRFLGRVPLAPTGPEKNAGVQTKHNENILPQTSRPRHRQIIQQGSRSNVEPNLSTTFGGDFDDDLINAVAKIESDYETKNVSKQQAAVTSAKSSKDPTQPLSTGEKRIAPVLIRQDIEQVKRTETSKVGPGSQNNTILAGAGTAKFNVSGLSLEGLLSSPLLKSTPLPDLANTSTPNLPRKVKAAPTTRDGLRPSNKKSDFPTKRSRNDESTTTCRAQSEASGEPLHIPQQKHENATNMKVHAKEIHKRNFTQQRPKVDPEKLFLSAWGLPDAVLEKYHSQGIRQMFEWQAECLCTGDVLNGKNLVYSAPTSAGKTLVAELLVLKRVVETKKKAIIILPFVSVAREKMQYLQRMFQNAGIRVDGYMGNLNPSGGFSALDIAICTIEKANGLVNKLLEEGKLDQLGILVVDELHMIGDSSRGYLLELLLTKVQFAAMKIASYKSSEINSCTTQTKEGVQIVGMSATLPNLDLLARWLDAELYTTNYRPVPLTEMVKISNTIYDTNMQELRTMEPVVKFKGDEENIINLCLETLDDNNSVLIFCPTKNWCEKLADSIAKEFYGILKDAQTADREGKEPKIKLSLKFQALRDTIEQLKRTPAGLDKMLGRMVSYGAAYHHAGLTFDERDIVEGAFRQGTLRVLVATSTLSSGVNLPARRVIIRSPIFHGKIIETMTYKQMVGRAGRKGVDICGESILVCKANERTKATTLVQSALPPVQSCLLRSPEQGLSSSMKRAILEVVVSGVASTPQEVSTYAGCTMLAASMAGQEGADNNNSINDCIQFLQDSEFIVLRKFKQKDEEVSKFMPTQLGSAVLASAMSPDEGLAVFAELQKARRNFVLENELHVVYMVTPIYVSIGNIDWYQYLCLWEKLPADMRRVAELVGVREGFLSKAVRGNPPTKTLHQLKLVGIHKRFYTALILHDLVNELSLNEVAHKYNQNRGMLQSLQQNAATFSGMVTVFCNRLGWHNMELLLSQFQSRLTFGVQRELVGLVRVSLLTGQRARLIYNGGYQTIAALAIADPITIETLLKQAVPFESKKRADGETEWEAEQRQKSKCVWLTGQKGLTEKEAALMIVEEAKTLLQQDLGEMGIEWKPKTGDKNTEEPPKSGSATKSGRRVKSNSSCRRSTPRRRSNTPRRQSHTPENTDSPAQGTSTNSANVTIVSPPPGLTTSINISRRLSTGGSTPIIPRPKGDSEASKIQPSKLLQSEEKKIVTGGGKQKTTKRKSTTPPDILHNSPPKIVRMQTPLEQEQQKEDKSKVLPKQAQRPSPQDISNHCAEQQDQKKNTHKSPLFKVTESLRESVSPCLFGEGSEKIQDDSFMLDTQTIKLMTDVSPSSWGATQAEKDHEAQKNTIPPVNQLRPPARLVGKPVETSTGPKHEKYAPKTGNSHQTTPPLFSEEADGDFSVIDDFMNNYCTQNDLAAHTASPTLDKPVHQLRPLSKCPKPLFAIEGIPSTNDLLSVTRDAKKSTSIPTVLDPVDQAPQTASEPEVAEMESDASDSLLSAYDDEQDLDVALNLSESFTTSDTVKADDEVFKVPLPKCDQCHEVEPEGVSSEMTDSLTYSMIANVLDCGMTQEMAEQFLNTKQSTLQVGHTSKEGKRFNDKTKKSPTSKSPSAKISKTKRNTRSKSLKDLMFSDDSLQRPGSVNSPSTSKNDSTASDFVPPTPPSDESEDILPKADNKKCNTPQKLIGGVSTPTREDEKSHRKSRIKSWQTPPTRQTPSRSCKSRRTLNTSPGPTERNNVDTFEPPPVSQTQSFAIIDVAADKRLFEQFVLEWKTKSEFAICLSCEKIEDKSQPAFAIGGNFQKANFPSANINYEVQGLVDQSSCLVITGMAVSWENRDVYFVSFSSADNSDLLEESLAAPPIDTDLSVTERLDAVREVLRNPASTICAFDTKAQYKLLCRVCDIVPRVRFEDPKIASWLLDPGAKEKNLHRMVTNFLPLESHLLDGLGGGIGLSSMGLTPENPGSGRVKASVESVLVHHLMDYFHQQLRTTGLAKSFTDIEMPSFILLAKMEMNGMGFSFDESERQKETIQSKLTCLEEDAYSLAGHTFSLTSPEDIAQVLFIELKLPPSGDPSAPSTTKTLGPRRATAKKGRGKSPFSTSKEILEKLKPLHPLPGIILEFRKISSTLSKSVFPLQKEKKYNRRTDMERIHGIVQVHTATGRVTMSEPNLQNIPKDYDIKLPEVNQEETENYVREINPCAKRGRTTRDVLLPPRTDTGPASFSVSMRHAFIPFKGGSIVAADYSQLELRIIAHLSRDRKLIEILNSGGDVFKTIAAQWKGIDLQDVTPQHRQQAKQVCYGMIYGIGPKALGEQLEVDEEDAAVFIESFKAKYTGMRTFLRETVEKCRSLGYVETVMKRRRYLPAIKDTNPHARSHAERQAVNTTVQGSAADLVKLAMVRIDNKLCRFFPQTELTHSHKTENHRDITYKPPCGGYFILQLHDELIYEVNHQAVDKVARLVKSTMESAMKLSVKLPVKVKVGPSWASLQDFV